MPPKPPELKEELAEEVLLRLPPDDPASLVSAALVCKLWCRLVCGAAFHRRFREFHRNRAPLLGVVFTGDDCRRRHDNDNTPQGSITEGWAAYFVPTTSFHPAHAADGRSGWRAIDARHGRVLLASRTPGFSVWDPVTGEQQDLPELPYTRRSYSVAVACAAVNCNHLDCHGGPFVVVAMGIDPHVKYLSVYSSESGAWSRQSDSERPNPYVHGSCNCMRSPSVLVGNALYFLVYMNNEIMKYDMATRQVSKIHLPSKFHDLLKQRRIVLMTDDHGHGGLGFVASTEYKLELWSMVADGGAGFVLTRVIDLVRPLPARALINNSAHVSGFADVGASRFVFMRTLDGLYSIEINSSQVKKVANCCDKDKVVLPYVSFCTPTSGTVVYNA